MAIDERHEQGRDRRFMRLALEPPEQDEERQQRQRGEDRGEPERVTDGVVDLLVHRSLPRVAYLPGESYPARAVCNQTVGRLRSAVVLQRRPDRLRAGRAAARPRPRRRRDAVAHRRSSSSSPGTDAASSSRPSRGFRSRCDAPRARRRAAVRAPRRRRAARSAARAASPCCRSATLVPRRRSCRPRPSRRISASAAAPSAARLRVQRRPRSGRLPPSARSSSLRRLDAPAGPARAQCAAPGSAAPHLAPQLQRNAEQRLALLPRRQLPLRAPRAPASRVSSSGPDARRPLSVALDGTLEPLTQRERLGSRGVALLRDGVVRRRHGDRLRALLIHRFLGDGPDAPRSPPARAPPRAHERYALAPRPPGRDERPLGLLPDCSMRVCELVGALPAGRRADPAGRAPRRWCPGPASGAAQAHRGTGPMQSRRSPAGSTAVVDELPSAPEAPTRMTLPGQIDDEAVAELQLEREEVARGCQREAGRPALLAGGDRAGDGAHPDDEPGSFAAERRRRRASRPPPGSRHDRSRRDRAGNSAPRVADTSQRLPARRRVATRTGAC